jgi:hypothetical protein
MERQSLADLLSEQENVCRLARSAVLTDAKYEIWEGVAGVDQLFDEVFATFCGLTTNMGPDKVLGRHVESPADGERFNASWPGGDPGHFGQQMFQFMGYRPMPNTGYRLPADGFYLVGPSTHPGSGVTGGARAGAQAILTDLGFDFAEVACGPVDPAHQLPLARIWPKQTAGPPPSLPPGRLTSAGNAGGMDQSPARRAPGVKLVFRWPHRSRELRPSRPAA